MILLSLNHINKMYTVGSNAVHAVKDVSIDIKEGEFFTLLGPSGCGKSTTLRCIAGLETPTSGEIRLGTDLVYSGSKGTVVPVNRRDIGMVFQSYAIWPHMNVFDNVAYPLRFGGGKHLNKNQITERVIESLSLVHLEDMPARPTPMLSGGQQQRVALARALVKKPKLLLLDEPLSNLDAKLREEMRTELRGLIQRLGITAVYVTHDQLEALVMSDRIAVMREGCIVQVANSHDIYYKPENAFVAGFIGATNFLEGRLKRHAADGSAGVVDTVVGPVRCNAGGEFADGQKVKLTIRPENIEVAEDINYKTDEVKKGKNTFDGKIEILDFHGDSLVVKVRVEKVLFQVKADPALNLKTGQQVYLVIPPEKCQAIPF